MTASFSTVKSVVVHLPSTTDIIAFIVSKRITVIVSRGTVSRFIFSHLRGITECGVSAGRDTTSGAVVWVKITPSECHPAFRLVAYV